MIDKANSVSCDLFYQEYMLPGAYRPNLFLITRVFWGLCHKIRKHIRGAQNSFSNYLQKCFHVVHITPFSEGLTQFLHYFFL